MMRISSVNNMGYSNNSYQVQNKSTGERPSTIIKEAAKSINNVVDTTSKNISIEKEKFNIEVSNAYNNIDTNLSQLKKSAGKMISSAVSIGKKVMKTAVSIGEAVAKVTTAVATTVTTISIAMKNPDNGIIKKGAAVIGAISTGYGASKEPVNNIVNSVSNLSGDIRTEYNNIAESFELSKSSIKDIKDNVVSVGAGVTNFVVNVATNIKDAGSQIYGVVNKTYNDIIGAYKKSSDYSYGVEGNAILI